MIIEEEGLYRIMKNIKTTKGLSPGEKLKICFNIKRQNC